MKIRKLNESSLVDKKVSTLGKRGKPMYFTDDQLKDAKAKYPEYDFEETTIEYSLPAGQKAYVAKKKKELSESISEWRVVASKSVPDFDGFMTDYTWYENINNGRHVFIFGDNDLYDVDSSDPDWETDSYEEAKSWFDAYKGFEDALEESLTEAMIDFKVNDRVTDGEKIGTVYKQDKYGLVAVEWDGAIKLSWVDRKDLKLVESLQEVYSRDIDKIDAELLVGKPKDEIKHILDDAPIGSQIIHLRDKSNRFNIDRHIQKAAAYKSNYYQGIGSPHDFKNREVFWKVAGHEDPYIVSTIYNAVNGIDKYMALTSEVLKSESGKTIKEDVAPFKNERFKKRLQDELYEAFIKLAKTPSWGYLDIKEIEDLISPVIEVNDYTGEYDNTHVVQFRGEVDYEELMEISDVLTKVIKQYDTDAYFEPVTSGITRAYIKVRKNVIESKITNVKETKKEIAQKILQVESKQELWDLITQVAAFDLGLYNQLMDIADLDLSTNIKLNRISNKLLGNKQKNESLIADEEDGWGDEIERILEPVFRELEDLIYEVRKAVRGAHTNCNTPSELAEYIQKISEELDDAANDIDSDADELLEAAENEEPQNKISEFMFLKSIYKTFKSFSDRDSAEYLDFLDDLTHKDAKFDVYNHRKNNGVTVFYDPQEDLI